MSTMKKTLALVLALVLIVSCIPATALTVFAEGETETTTKQICLQNFDSNPASYATITNKDSYGQVTTSLDSTAGVNDSVAAKYLIASDSGTNSENINFSFSAQTVDATDIIWFWINPEFTYDRLLHTQIGSAFPNTSAIYTIVNENGVATRKTVSYDKDGHREGDGFALVNSSGVAAEESACAYTRIRLETGWNGWIGIPVGNFCVTSAGAAATVPTSISSITFRTFGVKNTASTNQIVYFDELWLTDAKSMPNLTNEQLLFDPDYVAPAPEPDGTFYDVTFNGTGVESNGEATVEEGKTYSATLSAVAGYTLPETVTVTVGGEAAPHTYDAATGALSIANVTGEVAITAAGIRIPQIPLQNFNGMAIGATAGVEETTNGDITNTVAAGVGIGGSNALNYVIVATGSNNSNNVKLESILASHTVGAATDILWMWVDSDLTAERLLHIQGPTNLFNGDLNNAVLYTIVNDNGTARIQKKTDDVVNNTTLEGMGLVHSAWNVDTGSYARIKIPAGWYGWLGVPVSALGYTAGSAISNLKVRLYAAVSEAPIGANECFYIDELWLTSAELMPNLTNDELLYNGDQAYLSLNSRYADGMIFQQNKPFMIHGKANNGAEVKVELLDSTNTAVQTKTVTVGEAEEWSVLFEGVAGSYDAYSVKVTAGNLNKTISNVVFGEVWVAGGQSNMDYTINQTAGNVSNDTYAAGIAQAFGSDVDVAELQTRLAAEGSNAEFIRIYLQDSVTADLNAEHTSAGGRWTNGSVWNDVKSSSAIAFYYAEMLQKQLNVPVGIIETPKGGTSMAVWVDKDVLTEAKYPEAYKVISDLGYFTDTNAATHVASYFNSRINPFQGYEVKGVLWYQGENDRFNPQVQQALPPVLLESWSKVFTTDPANVSDTALDFVVFQIAPFIGYASGGVYPDANLMTNTDLNAAMREGFAKVAKTGNVVIVPIYDLSAVVDNHHPLNKLEVAKRLMAALNETYYAATFHDTYTGPAVSAVTYGEGTVTITFDRAVRYIQLTETGNQRINPRGGYTLPAATELWGDKANGFSLYTGKEYVSVETVAIDGNKVTLTVPEGVTSIAGVAYAYGVEVLSANIYSSTGLPALPFYAENPDYVPEPEEPADPVQVQLWDADDNTTGQTIGTVDQTTSHNHMSSTIKENVGVLGSKAWAYVIEESKSNNNYQKVTVNLADIGFDTTTTVSSTEQILWFWVDGDMENVVRMHVEVNGSRMSVDPNVGGTFYTIGEDENGKPVIVEVAYQYGQIPDNDGIDGLSFTHYNSAEGNTNKFARPVFTGEWSGWVGLPIKYLAENSGDMIAEGEAFAQLIIQGYRNNGFKAEDGTTLLEGYMKTGDAIYFDEFWLTDAGLMPKLSDEALLYKGDVVTPEPEDPTVYNVTFNGTNVTSNGAATVAEGESYTATLTAAEGYILPETVTVTVGGSTATFAYNKQTGALSISNVTGDVVITAVAKEASEPGEPIQIPLWNVESLADGATAGTVTNNTSYQQMTATVMENAGVLGSKAWVYTIETAKTNNNSEIVNIDLASVGFDTTAKITTDQILWFWVDSDAEGVRRMQFEINGIRLCVDHGTTGHKFYTITADANGKPQIKEFDYQYGQNPDNDGVDGLSILHYTSALNADGTNNANKFARPSFTDGWSGWVGLPLSYYVDAGRNLQLNDGDTLTKLMIQLYRNNGFKNADNTLVEGDFATGETLCLDEFWLTDVGLMPKLSDEALLYKGDVVNPEPEEPEVYNVTFNGTNVTSNGAATVTEGETYTATLTAAEGYVLPESVTVTVGGAAAEHTYNATTGELTIAGVTGDVVITAVGEEEPEPEPEEPVQVQLWNLESVAAGTTIGTVANGSNNTISSTAVADYGVLGSKAIAFTFTGDKLNTNNSGTATINNMNTLGFDTTTQISSYDQIVWFWVDSDLSSDQRLAILFNGFRTKAQGDIYTIQADSNGKPQIVKVTYQYSDADGDIDGIEGISYLDYVSNSATNQNNIGRVKISAGWSGWIGIAVNTIRINDSKYLKPTDTFSSITLQLYQNISGKLDAGTQVAGDTIYFDEFWLTDAGQMPKLSDEALLYKGDVEPLAFSGASLTLEEGISVNFKVDGDVIKQGYENPYAVLKIRDLEYTVEGVYNEIKDEYVFKLYNIRPDWMGETITAEIYATMDGEQVAGEAITYSVAQYCYNILQKNYATATEADKLATLLVNILSYGAAAQTYAGDTANGLVTDDLTETWAGWITTDYTAAAADTSVGTELAEPGVTFQSASLFLRESVRIRLKLAGTVTGPITVKVTDAAGNAITEASLGGCNGYVFLDGLNAQQMRTVLKITVYSGEEAVSNTLTYSIRSYADSFILADSTTALAKLMKAMMIYGDSAAAYIQ